MLSSEVYKLTYEAVNDTQPYFAVYLKLATAVTRNEHSDGGSLSSNSFCYCYARILFQ